MGWFFGAIIFFFVGGMMIAVQQYEYRTGKAFFVSREEFAAKNHH